MARLSDAVAANASRFIHAIIINRPELASCAMAGTKPSVVQRT
jgi:hypothetical protein